MPSDDDMADETESLENRSSERYVAESRDPDLNLTYDEAKERDDFRQAVIFTTEGRPEDKDKGLLRRDYDEPESEYALMIRNGESGTTKIKAETISKVHFPPQ